MVLTIGIIKHPKKKIQLLKIVLNRDDNVGRSAYSSIRKNAE